MPALRNPVLLELVEVRVELVPAPLTSRMLETIENHLERHSVVRVPQPTHVLSHKPLRGILINHSCAVLIERAEGAVNALPLTDHREVVAGKAEGETVNRSQLLLDVKLSDIFVDDVSALKVVLVGRAGVLVVVGCPSMSDGVTRHGLGRFPCACSNAPRAAEQLSESEDGLVGFDVCHAVRPLG